MPYRTLMPLFAALTLLSACGGGGGGGDDEVDPAQLEAPAVVSTFPLPNDRAVDVSIEALMQFQVPLDTQSLGTPSNSRLQLFDDQGVRVPALVDYAETGAPRLRLEPNRALLPGMAYTLRLAPGVRDLEGNERSSTYEFDFRVRAPLVSAASPFELVSTIPAARGLQINEAGEGLAVWTARTVSGDESLFGRVITNGHEMGSDTLIRFGRNFAIQAAEVADNGDALVVWTETVGGETHLKFRRFDRSTGFWSLVRTIDANEDAEIEHVDVEMNPSGVAVIGWLRGEVGTPHSDAFGLTIASNAETPTPEALELDDGDIDDLHVATLPDGMAYVAFTIDDGSSKDAVAVFKSLGGNWTAPNSMETSLSPATVVGLDAVGTRAFLFWTQDSKLQVRRLKGFSAFGAVDLDATLSVHGYVRATPTAEDGAVFGWLQMNQAGGRPMYTTWSSEDGYGTAAPLAPSNERLNQLSNREFQLHGNRNGTEFFAWSETRLGNTYIAIRIRKYGELLPTQFLGPTNDDTLPYPAAEIDPGGGVLAAWRRNNVDPAGDTDVVVTHISAGGVKGPSAPINPHDETAVAEILLDMDAEGRGLVIYREYEVGGGQELQVHEIR